VRKKTHIGIQRIVISNFNVMKEIKPLQWGGKTKKNY
jgi:hypothetical protein